MKFLKDIFLKDLFKKYFLNEFKPDTLKSVL